MRLFLLSCLACLLVAGCASDSTTNSDPVVEEGTKVGNVAPSFTIPDKDNNEVRLKNYRGKVVLLEFWSPICHTCTSEMKDLEILWNNHRDEDLIVIGISGDDGAGLWRPYIESTETESGFPRDWIQVQNKLGDIAKLYKVDGTPYRYLIDKKGVIVDNYLTADEMEAKVSAELAK